MIESREADFHRHTSIAPILVNNLFDNSAEKFDVDYLKTKIKEQDNTLDNQAKDIKQMKSVLYSLQENFKRAKNGQ